MLRSIKPSFYAFIAIVTSSTANAATVTLYDDRTTFNTATGSLTTETFDLFTTETPIPANVGFDFGDFSITPTIVNFSIVDPDPTAVLNVNGTPYVRGIGNFGDTFAFTFDTPITAFGIDLSDFNDDLQRTQVSILGQTILPPVTQGRLQRTFLGFISDMAFSSVTFEVLDVPFGEGAGIDNLTYGVAAVNDIPLPAAFPLFLAGLAGIGAVGWRRKRALKP